MRITILAGMALLAATSAKADVIVDVGAPLVASNSENFASLIYQFAPVTVPGTITAIAATYVGSVVPGLYLFGLNTVSDLTLTPYASIENVSGGVFGNGYSKFSAPPTTAGSAGTPQTIPAALFRTGFVIGPIGSSITASAAIDIFPDNVTALATGPILLAVDAYATITGRTYIPGAVGSLQVLSDASSVNAGRLTLAITYTPPTSVPEPMSLAVLGGGLLGLAGLRRRRSDQTALGQT